MTMYLSTRLMLSRRLSGYKDNVCLLSQKERFQPGKIVVLVYHLRRKIGSNQTNFLRILESSDNDHKAVAAVLTSTPGSSSEQHC